MVQHPVTKHLNTAIWPPTHRDKAPQHSILAMQHIVAWAAELALGGYSKPGFPGIIICEGLEEDVQEYTARLRSLKWSAMAVRADETGAAHCSCCTFAPRIPLRQCLPHVVSFVCSFSWVGLAMAKSPSQICAC